MNDKTETKAIGTPFPTEDEEVQFSIKAYKGIEIGLGKDDPLFKIYEKLQEQYRDHLVLVQQGKFLHGYDRTAYALSVLKKYKLKLVGTSVNPHIRVGFPSGNFKRRLWQMVADFGIPYVVALGNQTLGHTIYVSEQSVHNATTLASISDDIVMEVIHDLKMRGEVNKTSAKQLLSNPDASGFRLRTVAEELDNHLLRDIAKMPRDFRVVWGENVRVCMARVMRGVFVYGIEENKAKLLRAVSADVDLLKHYLTQAHRLNVVKIAFEHRVGLAVELGKLVGGLIRLHTIPISSGVSS